MKQSPESLLSAAQALTPGLLDIRQSKPIPVVLIDGRAGSGKSTFARLLQDQVFQETRQSPKVIHMDDLYPGWDGLAQGSLYMLENILKPIKLAGTAQWQRWDWSKSRRGGNEHGNGWRSFDGQNLLIVEGCGSVTEASKNLADLTIWLESQSSTRMARFLPRDGGKFKDHWNQWSAQEDDFYATHKSKQLCEIAIEN